MLIKKFPLLTQNIKKEVSPSKIEGYQRMMRSIIFLIIEIRPDITFTTSLVNYFIKNLSHQYIKIIKIIFKYLKDLKDKEINYMRNKKLKIKDY